MKASQTGQVLCLGTGTLRIWGPIVIWLVSWEQPSEIGVCPQMITPSSLLISPSNVLCLLYSCVFSKFAFNQYLEGLLALAVFVAWQFSYDQRWHHQRSSQPCLLRWRIPGVDPNASFAFCKGFFLERLPTPGLFQYLMGTTVGPLIFLSSLAVNTELCRHSGKV